MFSTRMNRRAWLKRLARLSLAGTATALGYSLLETHWPQVTQTSVGVPNLPAPFAGLKVALLADIHVGRFTGVDFVRKIVSKTNALHPDLIVLAGDFVLGTTPGGYFA